MNTTRLKALAVVCMLIDHMGDVLFPHLIWMRIIGRLAFPIYCFVLSEGAVYTKNWLAYAGRLLLLALVSEIPFDLAFFGNVWYPGYQNVFWTLLFGLCAIRMDLLGDLLAGKMSTGSQIQIHPLEQRILDWCNGSVKRTVWTQIGLAGGLFLMMAASAFCQTDYGIGGVCLVWLLYCARKIDRRLGNHAMVHAEEPIGEDEKQAAPQKTKAWAYRHRRLLLQMGGIVVIAFLYGSLEQWAALSVVPLLFYNGQRGYCPKWLQWGFYWFYPLHLVILGLIRVL
ncbi:MAG: hypothetical protein IJV50_01840 [Lachnospiraceae bacterium]|nr:hypothetical protein [Lachnospiraceae bacterium]